MAVYPILELAGWARIAPRNTFCFGVRCKINFLHFHFVSLYILRTYSILYRLLITLSLPLSALNLNPLCLNLCIPWILGGSVGAWLMCTGFQTGLKLIFWTYYHNNKYAYLLTSSCQIYRFVHTFLEMTFLFDNCLKIISKIPALEAQIVKRALLKSISVKIPALDMN